MKDWLSYLQRAAGGDVWGLALLDHYHRDCAGELPKAFLSRMFDQIWTDQLDFVRFHRVALGAALELLGVDIEAAVESAGGIIERRHITLNKKQLDEIADQYRPYGGREFFLSRLASAQSSQKSPTTARLGSTQSAEAAERSILDAISRVATGSAAKPGAAGYFDAFRRNAKDKADEVVERLRERDVTAAHKLAFVSIGGADGSELKAAMDSGLFSRGLLLEFNNEAADKARSSVGQGIDVVVGDAQGALPQAKERLTGWLAAGQISGAVISFQSVIHELPSRSSADFHLTGYIDKTVNGLERCCIVLREPCRPPDWPSEVQIGSRLVSAQTFRQLAILVADKRRLPGRVEVTSTGRVAMSSQMAVETLFKLFYHESLEYELGETVTSFSVDDFQQALLRSFTNADVRSDSFASNSFDRLYRQYGISAFSEIDGRAIGLPSVFVRFFAFKGL